MGLLDTILGAQSGGVLKQLASSLGINESDAKNAVTSMLPSLSQNVKRHTADESSLTSLLNALKKGNHSRYLEDPTRLGDTESIVDGNGILGHILGSKDASRQVAAEAAQRTGLDTGILKKMLPMLAGLFMGSLNKQASSAGILGALTGGAGGMSSILGGLSSILDSDGDGSIADDVLGMAKKFL